MPDTPFIKQFKAARRVSAPLLAVNTPDYASTMRQLTDVVTKLAADRKQTAPVFAWNVATGMSLINDAAKKLEKTLFTGDQTPDMLTNPVEALAKAKQFPNNSLYFFLNAHRIFQAEEAGAVSIAIWGLRDQFKRNERTLVLLAPGIQLPEELKQDVIILDEPYPDAKELKVLHDKVINQVVDLPKIEPEVTERAIEAMKGLASFPSEQSLAMSLTPAGLDLDMLWEKKRKTVEQTPGVKVYRGKETFADVRGVEVIKAFYKQLFAGKYPPSVIVFCDEMEKMFAGVAGDLSGTSQEQLGEFLRWMQDNRVLGMMYVGHGGCSKSYLAKAIAGEFQRPMIELNISALKGTLVGQTGVQTRAALKTITAIGEPLVIATTNSMGVLPPELRRRMQLGTWFFDLPEHSERAQVADYYIKKYELEQQQWPDFTNWTQYEISVCCELAWRLSISMKEAAKYVVPLAYSAPEKVEELRKMATGRFLSASKPGPYIYKKSEELKENKDLIDLSDIRSIRVVESGGNA